MTPTEARQQLLRIGRHYPTIGGLMAREDQDGQRLIDLWAKSLTPCDAEHVTDIVDEIIAFRRPPVPPGEPSDRVAFYIYQEAKEREHRRHEQGQRHEERLRYRQFRDARRNQRTEEPRPAGELLQLPDRSTKPKRNGRSKPRDLFAEAGPWEPREH